MLTFYVWILLATPHLSPVITLIIHDPRKGQKRTKLEHLTLDTIGVIDIQCENRVAALTLSFCCRFALGVVAP